MYGAEQRDAFSRADADVPALGTRFLMFPQVPHVSGYDKPETVWLSRPPGQVMSGPSDDRMYVRDPLLEKEPYDYPALPPFVGAVFPPAEAGPDGHFDLIDINSRQFIAAHAYASVRRVLDIWESYLGERIEWHFADTYERLEIIPYLDWDNAQSGYGYLELGLDRGPDGRSYPYAFNFDVIAHEVGHLILFSLLGTPASGVTEADYVPVHEANSDLISLLSFLHFDSGVDRLLRHCGGNLLVLNELNRIAELAGDRQIRIASNARRLSEVSVDVHDRSRPFTGAVFDTMVDVYHGMLVEEGLADERLLSLDIRDADEHLLQTISRFTANAYRARPFLFKSALTRARDEVARALAFSWPLLDPDNVTFEEAAFAAIAARERQNPTLARKFEENFRWREIV